MLMHILEAVILALVQGLTEFLPVSSSGHLIVVPELFGLAEPGLAFLAALHIGTLLAVLAYFRRDWADIVLLALGKKARFHTGSNRYTRRTFWLLVLATIPGAMAGYFLHALFESHIPSASVVAILILVGAGILWAADRRARGNVTLGNISPASAIGIGCAQVLALLPGISRSGITISAGLLAGLSRTDAARFSFLLAVPITLGASAFELPRVVAAGLGMETLLASLVAFVSAYAVIAWMLRHIERVTYLVFVLYGAALALAALFFGRS